ncbi:hypothetical protein EW146_g724 [Bondarzewia mesenterica]|uniref:Uncharacterized protein n=1 Tax=Bondarzewia mesenterica TaxID=1095465 RepID=A0A4S4M674_9AGAM|nr:hypothetical protein EW146_g724 [Bondarzewia mesenterica]
MLFAQFFYYRKNALPVPSIYTRARSRTISSIRGGRLPVDVSAAHYRTLSTVASHAAAAAALAAQAEEARSRSPLQTRHRRHSAEAFLDNIENPGHRDRTEDEDEVDEEALAALADSFHSEGGRSSRRKRVSWSKERLSSLGRASRQSTLSPMPPPNLHMTSPVDELDTLIRGRPLQRGEDTSAVEEGEGWWRAEDESQLRRNSRASRRGASMVFMGVWALFGVGTLVGSKRGVASTNDVRVGRVLSDIEVPVAVAVPPLPVLPDVGVASSEAVPLVFAEPLPGGPGHERPAVSWERIIGRISAWVCTTLYLTSRLPQIWKNFVRKSVEGLSMYLFVFAFLGNFFYVLSILSSPNMQLPPREASAYIRESIPYLLGSGGTLMFDVTIVAQSFIYRHKHPLYHRGRRSSVHSRMHASEEEGLLSAGANGAEDPSSPSRRRLVPTQAEGGSLER